MIGQTISHYRIVEKLGEGGMGVVYKAEDLKLGRAVALKFLPSHLIESEEHKTRFLHEARAAAVLDHSNICTVYEIDEANGQTFLAMACLAGQTLQQKIAARPLPLQEALDIALQIGQGLQAAHEKGIVHRDIKPANIMITPQNQVKIMDFGLARLSDRTRLTGTGTKVGTPAYMPPEQTEGRPTDRRSDIWALGVVLYEMISGHVPFPGGSEAAVAHAVLYTDPDPLTALRSHLPIELDRIIDKALSKDAADRYQHVDEMLVDLKHSTRRPASVQHLPARADPARGSYRSRWKVGAFAVLIGVAVVGAWWYLRSGREPRMPFGGATFAQLTRQPGQELYPSLSPDGKSLVYASPASGNWDIYLQRVGGKNPINLTKDSAFDDTQPAFSPEGERIAFRSEREGGGIFLMGATGESVKRLADFGYNPAWSPIGNDIVCSTGLFMRPDAQISYDARLVRVEVATGETQILSGSAAYAFQPHWSPNGRRIAYWQLTGGRLQDIATIPAQGGASETVTDDPAVDWNPVWSPDGKYLYYSSDRAGSMNLWRVAIDEESGKLLGPPEPITTPSPYSAYLSVPGMGGKVAYVQKVETWNLYKIGFDPAREVPLGRPVALTEGLQQVRYPDVSPDGQWIAFVSWGKREDLYLMRSDGTGLRQLTDDAYLTRGPRWSPDGRQILFFTNRSGKSEAWTINPDGSQARQVTDDPAGAVTHSIWSPDGRRTAHTQVSSPTGLRTFILDPTRPWSRQTPQMLPPLSEDTEASFWPYSWSPDGRKLAGHLQRRGTRAGVLVYSFDSLKFERLTEAGGAPRWLSDGRRLLFQQEEKILLVDSQSRRTREVLSVFPNEIEQ
ncbi:MAG: protein kinase [Bryobacterales bacterium]